MTMAWISRNVIYGNGQTIERCFAGGSCDPDIRKGGIVFGLPSGEHERYVGKRGIGVAPAPAKSRPRFARMARPTAKRRRMAVSLPPRSSARARARTGSLYKAPYGAKPLSRFTVEVFGNRASGSSEGEIFLGDVVTTSDAEGNGKFSLTVDASKLAALPVSFTATLTSSDGATSEFSKPITLSE